MLKQLLFPFYLILFALLSCDKDHQKGLDDDFPPSPSDKGRRTVLMYCAAQNSLGYQSYSRKSCWFNDSLELAAGSQFIPEDDRLLVFVDDAYHPRLYHFSANMPPQLVFQWGYDACSTHPGTFKEVLQRVKERFPADEYGLCMWSHADGWIPSSNTNYSMSTLSFGIDVGSNGYMNTDKTSDGRTQGAQMDIPDMANAIRQSGLHFKYIFFDACLMQCVESGYELRDVTDYIIASPISIHGNGAYYTHMLERALFSNNPCDIAQTYYEDVNSEELVEEYDGFGIVISALKTSELPQLAEAVREALKEVDLHAYPDLSQAHSYHLYHSSFYYRPHYYDMRSALRQLVTAEAFEQVERALSRAIPFCAATHRYYVASFKFFPPEFNNYDAMDCCGVSMFFPRSEYAKNASQCIFGNHNTTYTRTAWAKAIGKAN